MNHQDTKGRGKDGAGCASRYFAAVAAVLEQVEKTQMPGIAKAADLLADALAAGGSLFSFGASHAFMVTEELVYRAGGLMLVNPIQPHGMTLAVRPLTLTSRLERVVGLGRELLAQSPARKGDALVLTSNSGRNPVTIDMALLARETGIRTVAITSLAYVGKEASRHPCGKMLADLCDVVVDNCVPHGDAVIPVPGSHHRMSPVSTIASCGIANAIVAETVGRLAARGIEPPVFQSANVEGGEAFNARLLEKHRGRIHYL
jgi:uncharacterized phosphosugar-binding protein